VHAIGPLSQLKGARLKAWAEAWPLAHQPLTVVEGHDALTSHLDQRPGRCEAALQEPGRHGATRKVRSRLQTPGAGRTVFGKRPEVAMDTNTAERALRPPVGGRQP
jgi:hypothetical protein